LPLPLPVIAAIGAGFVLLLLALILLALRGLSRSRRRKRAQTAPAPLSVWSNAGISPGYPGAGAGVASPYAPTAYNGSPQPAHPANRQWHYAQQPYAQGDRSAQPQPQPYSGYAPYGAAPQGSRSHAVSGPVPSGPSSYDSPRSGSWQDGNATARCVNGHPMQANAVRCAVCGAERDQSGVMAPRDASSVPPWAQNR
jgi:hypothetical protein